MLKNKETKMKYLITILLTLFFFTTQSQQFVDLEARTGIDVIVQDNNSRAFSLILFQHEGDLTLSTEYNKGDYIITVNDATGVSVNDVICIKEGIHLYQGIVLNIATNTLTLTKPIQNTFSANSKICYGNSNLSLASGTLASPVIFELGMDGFSKEIEWDITSLSLIAADNSTIDFSKFIGTSAISNGILLTFSNTESYNILNWRSNLDLFRYTSEVDIYDSSIGGAGLYVLHAVINREDYGTTPRLKAQTGDKLIASVRDNITATSYLYIILHGHFTTY